MRSRHLLPLILASGALFLSACEGRTPKPGFTKESAPPPSASQTTPAAEQAPQTMAATQANCCCCACDDKACEGEKPAVKAATPVPAQMAAVQPARPAARPPARSGRERTAPPRRPQPPAAAPQPQRAEQGYERYQGPDIATRDYASGYGRQERREHYEERREGYGHGGGHDRYRGHAQGRGAYEHHRYGRAQESYREHAYVSPPPPPPPLPPRHAYSYSEQGSYSEHSRYSEQSSGYAYGSGRHDVAVGPCCAPRPLPAAGRDAGGYLTWPGKSSPAYGY